MPRKSTLDRMVYLLNLAEGKVKGDGTATVVDSIPTCDLCQKNPAFMDGKTRMGPWAYMCVSCSTNCSVGLGVGKGQQLVLRVKEEG